MLYKIPFANSHYISNDKLLFIILLCREHKNKIVKAAATAALVNPMSCAGRNYREVLNACYDKQIIYN